jgi:hypothetical protein
MALSKFLQAKAYCPNLPWCQDEADKLGPTVLQYIQDQESYYRRWAQRWFENMQFIYGNSSIKWSRRYDFAVDVDFLRRDVTLSQRASTNIARVVAEALASLIYSDLPTWEADAADESSLRGKRYASIYEKLLDAYMTRLCCDKVFATSAMCYVAFGQVAWRIDWDDTAGTILELPQWRKVKAPVFTDYLAPNPVTGGLLTTPVPAPGSNGQPYFEDRWEPVTDNTGRQVVRKELTGDMSIKSLTPFEYRRELGSSGMHDTRYVEQISLIDYDTYLRKFGNLPGKTKFADDIKPILNDSAAYAFAIRHFMRMQFTTPPTLADNGFQRPEAVVKSALFKNKVLVIEHFDQPDQEMWPRGRRVVVVNGQCTHVTEPQYFTNKKGGWHPFVEAQWMVVPPSSISSGPMDAVTAKNRELNVMDSLVATAARRNLGSVLLYKHGSGFEPQKLTGEPGQMQGVADPEGVRWLHDDMPIPPVVNMLRQGYKDDVYESSGAQDSLRGDRSKNVSSGYAFKQLEEREQRRLTPPRKNFENGVSDVGEKMGACLRQNVTKLDDQVMAYMKRAGAGEFTADEVISFLAGPVDYGIDVRVKPSSMVMKSTATEQANYLELAKGPAQMRVTQDAEVLDNFLEYFGAEKLRDGSGAHRDKADRECDIWGDMMRLGPDTEGIKPPIVLLEDDDTIHMAKHGEFIVRNSDELLNNEWLFTMVLTHNEMHRLQMQEKQGQAVPGTALQVPGIMAQTRQKPPPGMPQVFQQNVQRMQQGMAQNQAAQKAPQSPKSPAPVGSKGPPQTTVGAPSKNTQPATVQSQGASNGP